MLNLFTLKNENIMSATKSKKWEDTINVTIDENMRDYSNDPYFKKKHEEAAEFIKKHGLPKSFKKENK